MNKAAKVSCSVLIFGNFIDFANFALKIKLYEIQKTIDS